MKLQAGVASKILKKVFAKIAQPVLNRSEKTIKTGKKPFLKATCQASLKITLLCVDLKT